MLCNQSDKKLTHFNPQECFLTLSTALAVCIFSGGSSLRIVIKVLLLGFLPTPYPPSTHTPTPPNPPTSTSVDKKAFVKPPTLCCTLLNSGDIMVKGDQVLFSRIPQGSKQALTTEFVIGAESPVLWGGGEPYLALRLGARANFYTDLKQELSWRWREESVWGKGASVSKTIQRIELSFSFWNRTWSISLAQPKQSTWGRRREGSRSGVLEAASHFFPNLHAGRSGW